VGSYKRGRRTIEIEIFDYDAENRSKESWRIENCWERQHHLLLFDTNSKIKNLLKKKCI
jgi:hypothetical protein